MLFTKREFVGVFVIFLVLIAAIWLNMLTSLRKSRDLQRKSDIRSIQDGLLAFHEDFGFFPLAKDGAIVACAPEGGIKLNELGSPIYVVCDWLFDSLQDVTDLSYPAYLTSIPTDPHHNAGGRYHYVSDGERFQIFAALESENQDEYRSEVFERGLMCGSRVCNTGRSYKNIPLDLPLQGIQ